MEDTLVEADIHPIYISAGISDVGRLRPSNQDAFVELNDVEQVYNLGKTSIVQNAWKRRRRPWIHGWVFDLATGYIRPQTAMIHDDDGMQAICKFHAAAVAG